MRVRVSDEFFKKERDQAYADWRLSFWRELFQNSIDVGATEIRININDYRRPHTILFDDNPSNGASSNPYHISNLSAVTVLFSDNGPGMTRDVLENVYFSLGATTKTGANQIGGMGRARVLTCFAMKSYRIRSHKYEVIGHGGEYQVVDTDFAPGCALMIEADDTTVDQMTNKLRDFMEESYINARVYLNNERLSFRSDNPGRYVRDLEVNGSTFAKVYVNKTSSKHRVIVRVNGVSMFTIGTQAKAQIIVELDAVKSREVLTSNRDGLRWQYRDVLDKFTQEIAVNTNSALRPRYARRVNITRGGGLLTMKKTNGPWGEIQYSEKEVSVAALAWREKFMPSSNDQFIPTHCDDKETVSPALPWDDFGSWLASNFGDIHIYDETENPLVHKVVSNYFPENWQSVLPNNMVPFRKGGNIVKVLLMWKTAIHYALEVGMPKMNKDDISYGVGFVFADDRLAEHRSLENGGHVFTVRPVDANGKLAFSVRTKQSLKKLMCYAKHEVAHVAVSYHNEEYINMRESIDEVFDEAECYRRMKDALNAVPNWED